MLSVATSATVKLLQVAQIPGVGPARLRKILLAQKSPGLVPSFEEVPSQAARDKASLIIEGCHRYEVRIVSLADTDYPERLREIADAPPFLYIRGKLEAILKPCAAVVGTRKASKAGLRAANLIGQFLAGRGITVVSGLALGIDAAGHDGALAANGLTAAILAHGLHIVSPSSHKELADRILSRDGALVSEHPPGVPPNRAEFVRRNRIQSGLSYCSIVVESGVEGGAVHQANFTKKQGRGLFTVLKGAGRVESEANDLNEDGARFLVDKLGATALCGTRDLAKVLALFTTSTPDRTASNGDF